MNWIVFYCCDELWREYMVWQKWVHLQRKHIDNRTIKPQTIIKQPGYVKQPDTLLNNQKR